MVVDTLKHGALASSGAGSRLARSSVCATVGNDAIEVAVIYRTHPVRVIVSLRCVRPECGGVLHVKTLEDLSASSEMTGEPRQGCLWDALMDSMHGF